MEPLSGPISQLQEKFMGTMVWNLKEKPQKNYPKKLTMTQSFGQVAAKNMMFFLTQNINPEVGGQRKRRPERGTRQKELTHLNL